MNNIVENLCINTIEALESIEAFIRIMHPPVLLQMQKELRQFSMQYSQLVEKLEADTTQGEKDEARPGALTLDEAGTNALKAAGLVKDTLNIVANVALNDMQVLLSEFLQVMRRSALAQELLYLNRRELPHVNNFFLEHQFYNNVSDIDPESPETGTGIFHSGIQDDSHARGSYTLFIPESYKGEADSKEPWPLVIALHGGYGHGRDFLWTWIREARCRRFILLCPTSADTTWSLTEPAVDGDRIKTMVEDIASRYAIDREKILLCGFSDGGTFSIACAMQSGNPYTEYGIISGTVPPGNLKEINGKRIIWVHGLFDWMFPIVKAEDYSDLLKRAGANITFHKVENLSHAYPVEENDRLLRWFDPSLNHPHPESPESP